jgi:hypothetical protein
MYGGGSEEVIEDDISADGPGGKELPVKSPKKAEKVKR